MDSSVSISRLLSPDRIVVGLKAKSYEAAVARLLDRLDAAGAISDRRAIDELVQAEVEGGDVPTLGTQTLLAHYRSDAAKELAVAIGTSSTPFGFAQKKTPNARFLVLIVSPRSAARYYLKTLAGLSRLLRRPDVAAALAAARSPEEFLALTQAQDLLIRPELTVQDLMSRDVHTVSPEALLSEVLHLMVRHRRRGIPVVGDSGEVLGLVTDMEVLQRFLPEILGEENATDQAPLSDVEVREVMQRSVMCLSEDQLISDVLGGVLAEGGAQFPVVGEGKLVGVLSRSDLIEKLLEHATYKQP
jgi:CBS domain-containing protein/mannitol/fructose-specific phosphotransferase system IIA component (Ntr-type)